MILDLFYICGRNLHIVSLWWNLPIHLWALHIPSTQKINMDGYNSFLVLSIAFQNLSIFFVYSKHSLY